MGNTQANLPWMRLFVDISPDDVGKVIGQRGATIMRLQVTQRDCCCCCCCVSVRVALASHSLSRRPCSLCVPLFLMALSLCTLCPERLGLQHHRAPQGRHAQRGRHRVGAHRGARRPCVRRLPGPSGHLGGRGAHVWGCRGEISQPRAEQSDKGREIAERARTPSNQLDATAHTHDHPAVLRRFSRLLGCVCDRFPCAM